MCTFQVAIPLKKNVSPLLTIKCVSVLREDLEPHKSLPSPQQVVYGPSVVQVPTAGVC